MRLILLSILLVFMLFSISSAETYVFADTYGAPLLPADAHDMAMGGAGSANTDGSCSSLTNPAILAFQKNSRFVINAARLRSSYTTGIGSGLYNDYTLPWFSLNMANEAGYGVSVGYSEEYEGNYQAWGFQKDENDCLIRRSVKGHGVVGGYFIAASFKLNDKFAIGIRPIYYYGTLYQHWVLNFSRKDYTAAQYGIESQRQGFGGSIGLIWQASDKLDTGLSITAPAALSATNTSFFIGGEYNREDQKVTYPPTANLGITYHAAERTTLNCDLGYALWSQAKYSASDPPQVRDALSLRTGAEWYPLPRSSNFMSNVALRGGLYFSQGYPNAPGKQFNEYAVTVGTGYRFPGNQNSTMDFAAALGLRNGQSTADEQLFRVWVSFVGLENWFIKNLDDE